MDGYLNFQIQVVIGNDEFWEAAVTDEKIDIEMVSQEIRSALEDRGIDLNNVRLVSAILGQS